MSSVRPTASELRAAVRRRVSDLIVPGLTVLFCGINPGLYSAATGHHFARPGNRFWPAIHRSGFTPRQLAPWEEAQLLDAGCGITNLVPRTTAAASELSPAELRAGGRALERKLERYRPNWVAVLGIGAYRAAFGSPRAAVGRQPELLGGTSVWLLPSPSGLNANHQLPDLVAEFRRLRAEAFGRG
ncbi:MAG TPA: G/U mismatch-specific DNA glycosylase [Gemmatimonadales bacterium]